MGSKCVKHSWLSELANEFGMNTTKFSESIGYTRQTLYNRSMEQEGRRMTNAERMIKLLKKNDADELLDWWEEIFEDGVPQTNYFEWWLEQEYGWGEEDGN